MSKVLRVLIGCEYSAAVRRAFEKLGHYAMSCDLLETEVAGLHYKGDIFDILNWDWDLGIFHPPCTYLCSSGLHWNNKTPGRQEQTDEALEFVRRLMGANIPHWGLENPIGCISSQIRKPDQIVQPYEYGDDASKRTCLWTKDLPKLIPTLRVPGRWVEWPKGSGKMVERWANQTDSGQNNLGPSEDRWKERSVTYQGIADAMATQWSAYILKKKGYD